MISYFLLEKQDIPLREQTRYLYSYGYRLLTDHLHKNRRLVRKDDNIAEDPIFYKFGDNLLHIYRTRCIPAQDLKNLCTLYFHYFRTKGVRRDGAEASLPDILPLF